MLVLLFSLSSPNIILQLIQQVDMNKQNKQLQIMGGQIIIMKPNSIRNYLTPAFSQRRCNQRGMQKHSQSPKNSSQDGAEIYSSRDRSPTFSSDVFAHSKSPFGKMETRIKHLEQEYESISSVRGDQTQSPQRRSLSPLYSSLSRERERGRSRQGQVNGEYRRQRYGERGREMEIERGRLESSRSLKRLIEEMHMKIKRELEMISRDIKELEYRLESYSGEEFHVVKQTILEFVEVVVEKNRLEFKRQYEKRMKEYNKPLYIAEHQLKTFENRIAKIRSDVEIPHWQGSLPTVSQSALEDQMQEIMKIHSNFRPRKFKVDIKKEILQFIEADLKRVFALQSTLHSSVRR